MNIYRRNIRFWLVALVFTIGLYSLATILETLHYGALQNILMGIIGSILLLLLIEFRDMRRDSHAFGYLKGEYKRIQFFNINWEKKSDTIYELVNYDNVPDSIVLKYKGVGRYSCTIHYAEGLAQATLFVDSTNPRLASGKYQYTKKHSNTATMPDLGTYQLHVDELDSKRMYVFHKNLVPSGLATGYEVWERK